MLEDDQPVPEKPKNLLEHFLPYRGIAKEVFRELGGGEEFIRSERAQFYGLGEDPLDQAEKPNT